MDKKNIYSKLLLLILLLSLLLGKSRIPFMGTRNTIAKVGSKKITYDKFNKLYQRNLENIKSRVAQGVIPEGSVTESQIKERTLEQLIETSMMEEIISKYNLDISKDVLFQYLGSIGIFKEDGKFNYKLFKNYLLQEGISEEEYIKSTKLFLLSNTIYNALFSIPEIKDNNIYKNIAHKYLEQRGVEIIEITKDFNSKDIEITKEEEGEFYTQNKEKFVWPEYRVAKLAEINIAPLISELKVSEDEIDSSFNKNKDKYLQEKMFSFKTYIFKSANDAQLFLESYHNHDALNNLLKKIKPIIVVNDKAVNGKIDSEILGIINTIGKEKVSNLFKTKIGWVVIEMNAIYDIDDAGIVKIKEQIKNNLLSFKRNQTLSSYFDTLSVEASKKSFENLVKDYGITKNYSIRTDKNGFTQNNTQTIKNIEVVNAIFEIDKNNNYIKVAMIEGLSSIYVISLEEVIEPKDKLPKEATNEIHQILTKNKKDKLINDFVEDIHKKYITNHTIDSANYINVYKTIITRKDLEGNLIDKKYNQELIKELFELDNKAKTTKIYFDKERRASFARIISVHKSTDLAKIDREILKITDYVTESNNYIFFIDWQKMNFTNMKIKILADLNKL